LVFSIEKRRRFFPPITSPPPPLCVPLFALPHCSAFLSPPHSPRRTRLIHAPSSPCPGPLNVECGVYSVLLFSLSIFSANYVSGLKGQFRPRFLTFLDSDDSWETPENCYSMGPDLPPPPKRVFTQPPPCVRNSDVCSSDG